MKESDLNTIIKNSVQEEGWCFKISDQGGQAYIPNPFDLFGIFQGEPIYIESKIIKNGLYAFNLDKIEEHQYANLLQIEESIKVSHNCLIAVGFYKQREMKIIMFFDFMYIWNEKQKGRKSFLKKELEELYSDNMYVTIGKKMIGDNKYDRILDIKNLKDKIIYGKKDKEGSMLEM
jgi:penicillin-binding protein-related factor A (putative recombinase)